MENFWALACGDSALYNDIDVLDDTVQNSLPSNLSHYCPKKKRIKKASGGVEAASLLT